MSEPHEVLGVTRFAAEAEVRRRYLELVRQFPPDRDPERFAAIRLAYDQIRDPVARLDAELFELDSGETLGAIVTDLRKKFRERLNQAPLDVLLALAESS